MWLVSLSLQGAGRESWESGLGVWRLLGHAEVKMLLQYGFYLGLGFMASVGFIKILFLGGKKIAGLGERMKG